MPSHPFGEKIAATVLDDLKQTLRGSYDALTSPGVAAELQETLHDDKHLPDEAIAGLASEVVDLLSMIEHLLQPGHLVLADHFLGMLFLKSPLTSYKLTQPRLY
jgi:hypothetical protein